MHRAIPVTLVVGLAVLRAVAFAVHCQTKIVSDINSRFKVLICGGQDEKGPIHGGHRIVRAHVVEGYAPCLEHENQSLKSQA